jgi:hypothetical protein
MATEEKRERAKHTQTLLQSHATERASAFRICFLFAFRSSFRFDSPPRQRRERETQET